jgi:hypothetical protein
MTGTKTFESTLGDLIVALTEETVPVVSDKRNSYRVVSYIVTDLFRKKRATFNRRHEWKSEGRKKEIRPVYEKRIAMAGGCT